jgi:acyl-CoA thioesterase-2
MSEQNPPQPRATIEDLVKLLDLEQVEDDYFLGRSEDPGWGRLYGGHVLAQALSAAQRTVSADRQVHSVHGYFLLAGDVTRPVLYEVDRIRDGGSFTTRRVVARQAGKAIFHLSASFQEREEGFEHQDEMPVVPPPEQIPTQEEAMAPWLDKLPSRLRTQAFGVRAFEVRADEPASDPFAPIVRPPHRNVWMRARGPVPDDPALHAALFTYISDYFFLGTSLLPHGVSWMRPDMQVASLDHTMWFHAGFRVDGWLLYSMESPRASGGRGLVRGRIFAPDGKLVITSAQEGLIRKRL